MRTRNGLQIDQNLAFQRREWRVQRVGWWLLTGFVAAAALGLFGGGVLSRARAEAPDGRLAVEYERFIRVSARTRLTIHAPGGTRLELLVDREYLERFRIDRITPEPTSIEIGDKAARLTFDASGASIGILVDAEPLVAGRYRGSVQIAGGPAVTFTQLAYF